MRVLMTLMLLLCTLTVHAELLVVVAKDSPIESLSEHEVANIFLAKTNRLANGSRVIPLELKGLGQKTNFYYKISGKSPAQMNSYWATLIFTGKGRPPREFRLLEQLLRELADNPEAITYLPPGQIDSSVRVVYTLR